MYKIIFKKIIYFKSTKFQEYTNVVSVFASERKQVLKISKGYSPENFTVFRNIALNIFRDHGWTNIAQPIDLVPNHIVELRNLILA